MSGKPPALTGSKMVAILKSKGFIAVRQSGSHVILRHADGRRTTVPVHAGRDLGKGLLRQIMRDTGLTTADLI